MGRLFLVLILLQFFSYSAVGQSTNNCKVVIQMHLRSGDIRQMEFVNTTPSKKDCAYRAKLHSTNFAPREVARKKVTYEWNESGNWQ